MEFVEHALFNANIAYDHKIVDGTCSCLFLSNQ